MEDCEIVLGKGLSRRELSDLFVNLCSNLKMRVTLNEAINTQISKEGREKTGVESLTGEIDNDDVKIEFETWIYPPGVYRKIEFEDDLLYEARDDDLNDSSSYGSRQQKLFDRMNRFCEYYIQNQLKRGKNEKTTKLGEKRRVRR